MILIPQLCWETMFLLSILNCFSPWSVIGQLTTFHTIPIGLSTDCCPTSPLHHLAPPMLLSCMLLSGFIGKQFIVYIVHIHIIAATTLFSFHEPSSQPFNQHTIYYLFPLSCIARYRQEYEAWRR